MTLQTVCDYCGTPILDTDTRASGTFTRGNVGGGGHLDFHDAQDGHDSCFAQMEKVVLTTHGPRPTTS